MNSLGNSNIIRRGKRLAFLLRHDRNYPFDEHGWREISDLITHHGYTMDELKVIVETNNADIFDVMGRKVTEPVKGQIYIQNGKKILF